MSGILVTGFGPYRAEPTNPSGEIAQALDGQRIAGRPVTAVVLPVATERVEAALAAAIARSQPDLVVVLGVAPGRAAPALERVAVNVRDFPIPDVDGQQPVDEPVVPGAATAYLTGLPAKAILDAWWRAGIPGYVSNTAGTYVCNQAFYLVMGAARAAGFTAGLIHLPAAPSSAAGPAAQRGLPTMSLPMMAEAVRIALTVAGDHSGADLALAAGAVS